MYLFKFKAKAPFKGSRYNKLYNKQQIQSNKIPAILKSLPLEELSRPRAAHFLHEKTVLWLPHAILYHFLTSPDVVFPPLRPTGCHLKRPTFLSLCQFSRESVLGQPKGLPRYGAEQHMGEYSPLLALPVGNHWLGELNLDVHQSNLSRRNNPLKHVECWGLSSCKSL